MRKILIVLALLLLPCTVFAAIIKYSGSATNGASATGAAVSVYIHNTGTPATIYSDARGKSQLGNASVDYLGNYSFYVEEGTYDIYLTKTGMTTQANVNTSITAPSMSGTNAWSGTNSFSTPIAASSGGTGTTTDLFASSITTTCTKTVSALTIVNGIITQVTCT